MSKNPKKFLGIIRRDDHIEYHYEDRVEFRDFSGIKRGESEVGRESKARRT